LADAHFRAEGRRRGEGVQCGVRAVSKHSRDQAAEDKATVTSDSDIPQVEDTAKAESVDNPDEPEKADESTETADAASDPAEPTKPKRRIQWARVFVLGGLPALALLLALGAGFLKWQDHSARVDDITDAESPARQAMQAAKDSTIAMLSYKPDTVEKQLGDARSLLTGDFRDQYTSLTNDVVIPGAKQKQISAVATVPAVASVSADPNHAVVLVFVNQTVVVGQDAPTDTASSVRVTLDKIGNRWLISKFEPV
jgi:Mce-associated membrane protein